MLGIAAFRDVAGTSGWLKAGSSANGPKLGVIGNIGGKAALILRDPGETANKQLKAQFVTALAGKYGTEFAKSVAGQLEGSKPLSGRDVARILGQGDRQVAAQHLARTDLAMNWQGPLRADTAIGRALEARQNGGGVSSGVGSGGAPTPSGTGIGALVRKGGPEMDRLKATGTAFAKASPFVADKGAQIFVDAGAYANALTGLAEKAPGGEARVGTVQQLATKYAGVDDSGWHDIQKMSGGAERTPKTLGLIKDTRFQTTIARNMAALAKSNPQLSARYRKGETEPVSAALSVHQAQVLTRFQLLSKTVGDELGKFSHARGNGSLDRVANELVTYARDARASLERDIELLSDPAVLEGLSGEAYELVMARREDLLNTLEVLSDPEGPFQGLVAFAAMAAADPNEARKLAGMSDLGPPPPSTPPQPVATGALGRQPPTARDLGKPGEAETLLGELHVASKGPDGAPLSAAERASLARSMQEARGLLAEFGNDWAAARKELGANRPADMAKLIEFRKAVVDGLIDELRTGPGGLRFNASSVGSKALTSDYDITFASPGTDHDIQAMKGFNSAIKDLFGAQPGTVFDTNIYVQDYVTVREMINTGFVQEDNEPFRPGKMFDGSIDVDQHVMGLMKMRRTMDNSEWGAFTAKARSAADLDTADVRNVDLQYSEADALFGLANQRLVDKLATMGIPLDFKPGDLSDADRAALGRESNPAIRAMLEHQLSLPGFVARMTAEQPDLVLEARNGIYGEIAGEMRALDGDVRKLGTDSPDKLAGLHAEKMRLTGQAIFFAAEAYHSAGAVRHVVAGIQGGQGAKLSVSDLQMSVLEQIGDARMHSHAHTDPDFAVQASKYMTRVLDVLQKLSTGEGMVSLNRGEMLPIFDASGEALRTLMGRPTGPLPSAGDIALFTKYTLLACKKGEVEIKPKEAERLRQLLDGSVPFFAGMVPDSLKSALQDAMTGEKLGKPILLAPEARQAGSAVATSLFALQDGDEMEMPSRMTGLAATLDAHLTGQMPVVGDDELRAYYRNTDARLGLAADLTGVPEILLRA